MKKQNNIKEISIKYLIDNQHTLKIKDIVLLSNQLRELNKKECIK